MEPQKAGIGRIAAAIIAIAAMLPYLTLKIIWLSGNPVGIKDPAFLNDPAMVGLNAMTFGMAAVGLGLGLAFTMRWGMRLPGWLVLLPMWVGSGLLSTIVVGTPLTLIIDGTAAFSSDSPIESWVYLLVYAGFTGQGIGLMAAFALYARDRWPSAFRGYGSASLTRGFQLVVARGALLVVVLLAGIRLYWAVGGTAGLDQRMVEATALSSSLQQGFNGLLMLAGAVSLLVMAGGRRSSWPPLFLAWLGTGTMFGWGLYAMILLATGGPLGVSAVVPDLVELFAMLTGLAMGMVGAFLLVERSGGGGGVMQAAQDPLEGQQREGDRETADHGHR